MIEHTERARCRQQKRVDPDFWPIHLIGHVDPGVVVEQQDPARPHNRPCKTSVRVDIGRAVAAVEIDEIEGRPFTPSSESASVE